VQNLKNCVKLRVNPYIKSDIREYRVIVENAPFHSAFSAKTLLLFWILGKGFVMRPN
jgi:hypothetical protein